MRSILLLLPLTFAGACTATAIDANNPLSLLVGPDGGSVESDGLKIDVPAGALSSEVTLTAYPKDRVIDGVATASSTWSFGPEGQTFQKAIAVSFAYDGQHDNATVWWTKEGDLTTFSNLKTTKADGWATANVVHFSEGAVGDDTCGSGSGGTDEEDADNEEEDGGDDTDDVECEDGVAPDGSACEDGDDGEEADDEGDDTDDVECEDGVAPDGSACEDGDEADGEDEDDGGDESDGVDCEDGIDAATGEECDGGPSANQDDGEEEGDEADAEEEHGSCERDESEANDVDDGEDEGDDEDDGDEGDDTDNVEE